MADADCAFIGRDDGDGNRRLWRRRRGNACGHSRSDGGASTGPDSGADYGSNSGTGSDGGACGDRRTGYGGAQAGPDGSACGHSSPDADASKIYP